MNPPCDGSQFGPSVPFGCERKDTEDAPASQAVPKAIEMARYGD